MYDYGLSGMLLQDVVDADRVDLSDQMWQCVSLPSHSLAMANITTVQIPVKLSTSPINILQENRLEGGNTL